MLKGGSCVWMYAWDHAGQANADVEHEQEE